MLYEKLNPGMKKMVDDYARRLRIYDWSRRSALLAEVSLPFAEELDPRRAKLAAAGFLTGVLERWNVQEIENLHQARLYLMSLNPEHRELAERWLDEHPEERAAIEKEAL
ncbi:MAG TPA: hypothetical protein VGX68_28585 [Thermoanaerobaculia bacterium]|jgi:hypothetical protein|nr:hypothetical protein [Thermoanaerobaculia bacterium]